MKQFTKSKPPIRYDVEEKPVSKRKKRIKWGSLLVILAILGLGVGLYLLSIQVAPKFANNHAKEAAKSEPTDDRIIITSADINAPIFSGGAEVLKKGAWHRFPERGDPVKGGNFVVTAHRFVMTKTPWRTMNKSTFYNINDIHVGDEILIHWQGKKYKYTVAKKYEVKPNQTEIENESSEAKLTVYTCTLGGTYDGREVVEAVPVY